MLPAGVEPPPKSWSLISCPRFGRRFTIKDNTGLGDSAKREGKSTITIAEGEFVMYGGLITNCRATPNQSYMLSYGGAIYVHAGIFEMYGGTISNNIASCGGAIFTTGGDVLIHDGLLEGNEARGSDFGQGMGGAILAQPMYSSWSHVRIYGGTIRKNRAKTYGGGVAAFTHETISSTAIIEENEAGVAADDVLVLGTEAKTLSSPLPTSPTVAYHEVALDRTVEQIGRKGMAWRIDGTATLNSAGFPDLPLGRSHVNLADQGLPRWSYDFQEEANLNSIYALFLKAEAEYHHVTYEWQGEAPEGIELPEEAWVKHDEMLGVTQVEEVEGWTFKGWFFDPEGTQIFDTSIQISDSITIYGIWEPKTEPTYEAEPIVLSAMPIQGYLGGTSASGNSMPNLRFGLSLPEGVSFSALTFEIQHDNGKTITLAPHLLEKSRYYAFHELEQGFNQAADYLEGEFIKLVRTHELAHGAGLFNVEFKDTSSWHLVAKTQDGKLYKVELLGGNNLIEMREVAYPTSQATTRGTAEAPLTTPALVVHSESDVTTFDEATGLRQAIALTASDANFYTNGKNAYLGVMGAVCTCQDESNPQAARISLLFDEPLVLADAAGNNVIEQAIVKAAVDAAADPTLAQGGHEVRYLDLVNADDGNAWVGFDQTLTIWWPLPLDDAGLPLDSTAYDFTLVHASGLERNYQQPSEATVDAWSQANLQNASAPVTFEVISTTVDEKGIKFVVEAAPNGGAMSPYVLFWNEAAEPDAPAPQDDPGEPTEPQTPDNPDDPATPDTPGNPSNPGDPTASDTLELPKTSDVTKPAGSTSVQGSAKKVASRLRAALPQMGDPALANGVILALESSGIAAALGLALALRRR